GVDHAGRVVHLAHVSADRGHCAVSRQLLGGTGQVVGVDVADDGSGAVLEEERGDRLADAGGTSCHQCSFSGKSCHRGVLLSFGSRVCGLAQPRLGSAAMSSSFGVASASMNSTVPSRSSVGELRRLRIIAPATASTTTATMIHGKYDSGAAGQGWIF